MLNLFPRALILTPVFLAIQAGGVFWIAGVEHPPSAPDFSKFPASMGTWKKLQEDPIDPETIAILRADKTLNIDYAGTGALQKENSANLFVAWFQSQRGGASQPHSPQVCLPANGWVPEVTDQLSLGESLPINRYIASLGTQRAVVLYWYQTSHRVMASEWEAKFWVMADAVKDKRTDTSLVRVVVFNGTRSDEQTTQVAMDFARQAYPALKDIFPR